MNDQNNSCSSWCGSVESFSEKRRKHEKSFGKYRGEAIGAIIGNLIWLWIINHVQDWNLSFILSSFGVLLWIWNINACVQILTSLLIIIVNVKWFRYLLKSIMEAAGFVSLIATYFLYPFNFSGFIGWSYADLCFQIALIIGMAVTAISVVTYIWRMLFWR